MSAKTEAEKAAKEAEEKSKAAQLDAAEKFEKRTARHRHHWPFTSTSSGEIGITRCECGEPYPRATEVTA